MGGIPKIINDAFINEASLKTFVIDPIMSVITCQSAAPRSNLNTSVEPLRTKFVALCDGVTTIVCTLTRNLPLLLSAALYFPYGLVAPRPKTHGQIWGWVKTLQHC